MDLTSFLLIHPYLAAATLGVLLVLGAAVAVLTVNILLRRRAEAALRLNESRLEALLELAQMTHVSLEELTTFALEEAVRLTSSELGYLAFMNEDETVLEMHAWSRTTMRICGVEKPTRTFVVSETGLWGEPARQRKPLITNDYLADNPLKKGLPPGHVPLRRHMSVPVMDDGRIVALAGVSNKKAPYDAADVRQLELLMDGMWKTIRRQRAEEALQQSVANYQAIFDAVSDAIFIRDPDTLELLDVNAKACEMFAASAEVLKGSMPGMFVSNQGPYTTERMCELMRRSRQDGPRLIEWQARDSTGRLFTIEVSLRTAVINGKERLLSVVRDVTERKRAEEERHRLEVQLQHSQRLESLGILAGGIAHDFNNLLTAVMGNADMALLKLKKMAPDSPAEPFLQAIKQAGARASELTQQMLTYSGRGRAQVELLALNQVIGEMGQLLQASIPKKVALRYELADDLPDFEADASQMQQVVMNLILNAAEAIDDPSGGEVVLRTRVLDATRALLDGLLLGETLPPGRYVSLEVEDTGCGMDEATQRKVFDPFFSTKFTGRGLGLAAVLGILRRHRGAIRIRSAPGCGSTFTLLFPAASAARRPAERRVATDKPWQCSGRVLVVDDEEPIRKLARAMLEHAGFKVLTAADGVEGVALFTAQADKLDAVLLDLTMPRMGGEEALREMRRIRPEVRIVLTSGHAHEDLATRSAGCRADGFLQKPFEQARLVEALRQALEG